MNCITGIGHTIDLVQYLFKFKWKKNAQIIECDCDFIDKKLNYFLTCRPVWNRLNSIVWTIERTVIRESVTPDQSPTATRCLHVTVKGCRLFICEVKTKDAHDTKADFPSLMLGLSNVITINQIKIYNRGVKSGLLCFNLK